MKRLFIGIELPDEARAGVVKVQEQIREVATRQGVRFVSPGKLHLTLLFLDGHPEEAIDTIDKICGPVYSSFARFDLSVVGVGAFPTMRRPKVIWLGIGGETETLFALQSAFAHALTDVVKHEPKEYSAHVTLARVNPGSPQVGRDIQPLADRLEEGAIAAFRVGEVVLFESTPDGRYEPLRRWPLGG